MTHNRNNFLIQTGIKLIENVAGCLRSAFLLPLTGVMKAAVSIIARRQLASAVTGGNPGGTLLGIPLSKPIPTSNSQPLPKSHIPKSKTQVTKLANGLTVASEDHQGQFATVGVLTNSGSRNEVAYISGINHFLEKLAFTSTERYESREEINTRLEKHGGIFDCQCSRDTMIHAISVNKDGLDTATEILSQVVWGPKFTQQLVEATATAVAFELENIAMNPNKELRLTELIHSAAYKNNTLGLPKICPPGNIPHINSRVLYTYLRHQCVPSEMVLAGVGMSHEQLVQLATEFFMRKPVWENMELDKGFAKDISYAQYTGGIVQVSEDLSNVSLGPTPMPELGHIVLGLESCSHKDNDFVAFCVLNSLMGGGGSFSAGGPGKGMYTRLYTNVLNRHFWIDSATAFNHAYNDTGLFVIHGSSHPSKLTELAIVLTSEMRRMAGRVGREELNRAKRQLQSMLMMNLESRPVIFEDLGRQVLATGSRLPAAHYFSEIEKISSDDIQRVANKMLRSRVSVAALGTLDKLPSYDSIQDMLASNSSQQNRFSLFSQ